MKGHVVFLTPEMMHHVEVSYLREEASDRLAVVLPVADGSRPEEQHTHTLLNDHTDQSLRKGPNDAEMKIHALGFYLK